MGENDNLEFFGVTIKCKSAHLAALLNSSVTEDVVVVGSRAKELFAVEPRHEGPATARSVEDERDELLAMIAEAD
jgi:hypothetical protein